jgi:malonyl-CoA O-methyltransferase
MNFNKAAPHYHEHAHLQAQVRQLVWEQLVPLLHESRVIADIGCGPGSFDRLLAQRENDSSLSELHQIDQSEAMCKVAEQNARSATHTLCADMHALPLDSASVDVVISSLALQWSRKPHVALSEMRRIVRPQGRGICATLLEGSLTELRASFLHAQGDAAKERMLTFRPAEYFEKAGYDVEVVTIREYHASLFALLKSIKRIGASYSPARVAGQRGETSRGMFDRAASYYDNHYRDSQNEGGEGLPATWKIGIITWQV